MDELFSVSSNSQYIEELSHSQHYESNPEGLQVITTSYYLSTSSHLYNTGNISKAVHNGSSNDKTITLAEQQLCTLVQFIFDGVIQGIISLVCFVVNFLTIATFSIAKPFNVTSFLLILLAAFDIGVTSSLVSFTWLPAVCAYANHCKHFMNVTLIYLQAYVTAVESFLNQVGVYVVTQVALHRYIAVCHPHHIKRFTNVKAVAIQTVGIIIFSAAFNTPKLFEKIPTVIKDTLILGTSEIGMNAVYQLLYSSILYILVLYALPFGVLIFLTYKLIIALRRFYARREQMTSASMRENAFTKTLVVMMIVCLICQACNPVRRFMVAVRISQGCGNFYFFYNLVISISVVFESTAHFFIYCVFDKRFVHNLRRLLPARHGSRVHTSAVPPDQGMTPATRQTPGRGQTPDTPQSR